MTAQERCENPSAWTDKDVLQYLCFEMGKERKQGRISKAKMMDPFLKLLSEAHESAEESKRESVQPSSAFASPISVRRQRKACKPSRVPPPHEEIPPPTTQNHADLDSRKLHKPSSPSILPSLNRSSCCICKQSHDHMDPSLWLSCTTSDAPLGKPACGLSCHVECALKEQVAGVVINNSSVVLDGSYRCRSCGRISSLIGYWKTHLLIAKGAHKVDILLYRLSLSHRLLDGTTMYKDAHGFIDEAVRSLEQEVGPMVAGSPTLLCEMVNRLSCKAEVQKLIHLALEKVEMPTVAVQAKLQDSKLAEDYGKGSCAMHFEDVRSSSVVVAVDDATIGSKFEPSAYKVWHRIASEPSYPCNPTCVIPSTSKKALISNLQALTRYAFKIVPFSSEGDKGQCEGQCYTKDVEALQKPMKVPSFLDLNVSHANKTDGNAICGNQGLEMKPNSDELNDRCQTQDCLKRRVDQRQEQSFAGNGDLCQSMASPRIPDKGRPTIQKIECLNASFKSKLTDVHLGATNVGQVASSSTEHVREKGITKVKEVPLKMGLADRKIDKERVRNNSCKLMEADHQAGEPGGVNHLNGPEACTGKERECSFDAMGHLPPNNTGELCPTVGKTVTTGLLESDHPPNSWTVQVWRKQRSNQMKARKGMVRKRTIEGVETLSTYMNGGLSAVARADCAATSFEFSVKVIRWLECEGHLKEDFRMKFLTWYCLKASEHEKRVISVFIDTLQDDPASLADQLVDVFEDIVATKRQHLTSDGCYSRLC